MRTLSAVELPDIWERGEYQHPLDRAITLLEITCPEKNRHELVHLSISQRDALLFELRKLTFGLEMESYAECPACGAELEFKLNIDDLLRKNRTLDRKGKSTRLYGFNISFRMPDSTDIAECVNSGLADAEKALLQNCILKVTRNKKTVAFGDIPEAVLLALNMRMAKAEPLSDVQITLNCNECNHRWSVNLDILSFLWDELGIKAKQILNQVHVLSRAYGWREADILAMSAWRRQYYLDMVT